MLVSPTSVVFHIWHPSIPNYIISAGGWGAFTFLCINLHSLGCLDDKLPPKKKREKVLNFSFLVMRRKEWKKKKQPSQSKLCKKQLIIHDLRVYKSLPIYNTWYIVIYTNTTFVYFMRLVISVISIDMKKNKYNYYMSDNSIRMACKKRVLQLMIILCYIIFFYI